MISEFNLPKTFEFNFETFNGNQKCCYNREDKSEKTFYYCPCSEDHNRDSNTNEQKIQQLICYACKKICHADHQAEMIKITGYFECSCGMENHKILRDNTVYKENFEKFLNIQSKCFFSYFDTKKELKIYSKSSSERLCEICISNKCYNCDVAQESKGSKDYRISKEKLEKEINEAEDQRKKDEYKLIDFNLLDPSTTSQYQCTCKEHYRPNFISIWDEFSSGKINFKKHFLNFNINFLLRNKIFIENVVVVLLDRVQQYYDQIQKLQLFKSSIDKNNKNSSTNNNNNNDNKENSDIVKIIKNFYKDFNLLNTISFIRKMIDKYSKRNDTTMNIFSHEYYEYIKNNCNLQNSESNSNLNLNFTLTDPLTILKLLEFRVDKEDIVFEEYSTYFLIKFSFLHLLHNIYTVEFIKSTSNTLNSNELLNLSFVQRFVYLQKSSEFFYLSQSDSGIKKYENVPAFIAKFAKVLNDEMESFLAYMHYSKKANTIFTENTFRTVIDSYINSFHYLIKYNLVISNEEVVKFYNLCFDLLVLSLNFYSAKEKERNEILKHKNKLGRLEEIDRLEETILKFKSGQNYVFTLVRSIFFFLINKNDEVFTSNLQSSKFIRRSAKQIFSNIKIKSELTKKYFGKKYVQEKSNLNNLAARVFCICLYHYMMITYKETEKRLSSFLKKITQFDFYARHIFEFFCDDSQNYLRTLDIMNINYNNTIIEFFDEADKLKLNFNKESFLKDRLTIELKRKFEKKFENKITNDIDTSECFELEIILAQDYINETIDCLNYNSSSQRQKLLDINDSIKATNNKFFNFEIDDFTDYFKQMSLQFSALKVFLNEIKDENIKEIKKSHALMLFSYTYQLFNEFFQIACVGLTKINDPNYEFYPILFEIIDILEYLIEESYSNCVMILSLDSGFFSEFVEKAFENYLKFNKNSTHGYKLVDKYFSFRFKIFSSLSNYSRSVCMSCLNNFIPFVEIIDHHVDYIVSKHKKLVKLKYKSSVMIEEEDNEDISKEKAQVFEIDDMTMIVLTHLFNLYKELIDNCSNENIEIYDGFESFQMKIAYFQPFLTYEKVVKVLFSSSVSSLNTSKMEIGRKNLFFQMFISYLHMICTAFECDFYLFNLISKECYLFEINFYNYLGEFFETILAESLKEGKDKDREKEKNKLKEIKEKDFKDVSPIDSKRRTPNESKKDLLIIESNRNTNNNPTPTKKFTFLDADLNIDAYTENIDIIINFPINLTYNLAKFYFFYNKGKFKFNNTSALINKYNNIYFTKHEEKSYINKKYNSMPMHIKNKESKEINTNNVSNISPILKNNNNTNTNTAFKLNNEAPSDNDDRSDHSKIINQDDDLKRSTLQTFFRKCNHSLLTKQVISAKKEFNLESDEGFEIILREDDDPYTLKKKLMELYHQTGREEYLKRAKSETEDILLFYKYLQYNDENSDLGVLMNEFSVKVIEKNIGFIMEVFLYKLVVYKSQSESNLEKDDSKTNLASFNSLFKYYQNVIVRQMYFLVNFFIIHRKNLKGILLERLHNNLALFLKVTATFYSLKHSNDNNSNKSTLIKDYSDKKEKQIIKAELTEELKNLVNKYYESVLNGEIRFYDVDKIFEILKNIFGVVFDKIASNSDLIENFKTRYFLFEKTYYKQFDSDHRVGAVQQENLNNISKFVSSLHLRGNRKIYYDCFLDFRTRIANCFDQNLALIKCFEFNDLSNKEFLPESCFFYLLNKIFDNSTFTSILFCGNDPSVFIKRNLNEGFANVHQRDIKIHNSFAIRLIRNLTFNDIDRFQKLFIKHFERSKNGVKLLTVLVQSFVFPFTTHETAKILELGYYDKKNNTTYDLAVSTLNFFQHLCESTCKKNQNLFFCLQVKPDFSSNKTATGTGDGSNTKATKENALDFIKYSFINFLFKLLSTCFKAVTFEDPENHRYQMSYFRNNSPQMKIFSRITDFILEVSNGFEEGKNSRYFFKDIPYPKDIYDWEREHKKRIKNDLSSKNGRFDLLGDFANNITNLNSNNVNLNDKKGLSTKMLEGPVSTTPVIIAGTEVEECEVPLLPQAQINDNNKDMLEIKKKEQQNQGKERIKGEIMNMFKQNFIQLNAESKGLNDGEKINAFHEIIEFKLITLTKSFKLSLLKFGYHNEKNSIMTYNFLRILYSLLYDTAIYKRIVGILNTNLLANISYNYLKFVFIRNIVEKEYDDKDYPMLLKLVPVINEKVFYELYFMDRGETYNDIYFKISYSFYMIILLYDSKYSNIDAKLMLSLEKSKMKGQATTDVEKIQKKLMQKLTENSYITNIKQVKGFYDKFDMKAQIIIELNKLKVNKYPSPDYFVKEIDQDQHLSKYPNFQHSCRLLHQDGNVDILSKLSISENRSLNNFYLNKVMGKVEFNINNRLFPMVYVKNPELNYFNEERLQKFYNYYSDHSDSTAKINSLLDYTEEIITEVEYYIKEIKPNKYYNFLWEKFSFNGVDMISLIFTGVIMILLLATLRADNIDNESTDKYYYWVIGIAIHQLILNTFSLFVFILLRYPLEIKLSRIEYQHQKKWSEWFYVYVYDSVASNSDILFTIMNIILAGIGISSKQNTFLFAFQLFTFNKAYLILNRILEAFRVRIVQLLNMICLLVIFIYFYANMGFYFMSEQFDISGDDGTVSRRCPNIVACFIRHFDFGQRSGAGISDDLSKIGFEDSLFYGRFFYDMVFFIIVKLLLLNMINGIIVQTFSDLRESDDEKQEDRKGQCFICSIEKKEFEKQNVDFDNHVRVTHSVTQYVNYIIQLKLASPYDLTYNESEILEAFKNRKVDIFPIYKTSDMPEYNHEEIEEEEEED